MYNMIGSDDFRYLPQSRKNRYEWISFRFCEDDYVYLRGKEHVYLFGAGNWGLTAMSRLSAHGVNVRKILVSAGRNTQVKEINGCPVVPLNELSEVSQDSVCLIAVGGPEKKTIQHTLREKGFTDIIPITRIS